MKKIQTNQTKEKFYEKLNMEYQKERNHDKWHPCTHLIKKDGKYYVYYRSGKNDERRKVYECCPAAYQL